MTQAKMTHKHIQTKANTDKLCETMQNQRNLGVRFKPFPLFDFSPPLESCSNIYVGLFHILFLWCFPLFIFQLSLSVDDLLISVCALKLSALFALSLQDTPLTADWLQMCISKIAYCTIKVNNSNDPARLNIQYWLILVNLNISNKGK